MEYLRHGASGFWLLAGALADRKGANVTCLVRDWSPEQAPRLGISTGQRGRGELEDYATVLRAVNEYEIDTVSTWGTDDRRDRVAVRPVTFESNIKGLDVLEACRICAKVVRG